MDFKAFPFELVEAKAGDDGPQFTGYLSTFGNVDHGDDVVMAGAFDRTLKECAFRPLLWSHDQRLPPIGLEKSLTTDAKGLLGTWSLIDSQLARDVYAGLKVGAIRSMSMGYQVLDAEFDDSGVRKLIDVELLEASLVNIPMNEQAVITTVKALVNDDTKFPDFLKQVGDVLESCATKAGALVERRADEQRELSEANREAIKSLLQTAGAVSGTLEGLIAGPPKGEPAMNLRLELARRRLSMRGILEPTP